VLLSEDVTAVANKLITLKELYPKADVFTMAASRPRTLLQSDQAIRENAAKVTGKGFRLRLVGVRLRCCHGAKGSPGEGAGRGEGGGGISAPLFLHCSKPEQVTLDHAKHSGILWISDLKCQLD
jgi:hypothetical protein